MYLELKRQSDNGIQTIGKLYLKDSKGNTLLSFDTLELSYRGNQRQISCIPTGVYVVKAKYSFRFGKCFELQNVLGRSAILIHHGNFNADTHGCILIGQGFRDIDFDDQMDVLNSRLSMKQLLNSLRSTTTITITQQYS